MGKTKTDKGRGLELTENGKALYEQSRQILDMIGSLKIQSPIKRNYLRIGFPEVLAFVVSESITRELREGLVLEDLDSGEIETRILDRRIDFGFTFIPFPHKELEHLKIATVSLASYSRIDSFRGQAPERIPYVIPSAEIKDNPLSIRIRDGWNTELPRLTPYRASSLSIALSMVRSGACAIYTPSFVAKYLNETEDKSRKLTELELPQQRKSQERTRRDLFLVKKQNDDETKVMKTTVKIVKQLCKEGL